MQGLRLYPHGFIIPLDLLHRLAASGNPKLAETEVRTDFTEAGCLTLPKSLMSAGLASSATER